MKWTQKGRAVLQRTRAAVARIKATIHASRRSEYPARSSRAARTYARRTTAAAIARPRAMRKRSIRRRAISASGASFEKRASNGRKLRRSHIEHLLRLADVGRRRRDGGGAGRRRPILRDVQALSAEPAPA